MRDWAGEPNRIPAEPIILIVQTYLDTNGDRVGNGVTAPATIESFAVRADILPNTLEKILGGGTKTIDFNTADRLLCAANMNDLWWTDLKDIYDAAWLADDAAKKAPVSASGSKMCARRGCSERFVPHVKVPYQKYCSVTCKNAAWTHKNRPMKTGILRGKGHVLTALVCMNGHERTKENTVRSWHGTRDCLICRQIRQERYRKQRRAKMLKRARQARYRQKLRERRLTAA